MASAQTAGSESRPYPSRSRPTHPQSRRLQRLFVLVGALVVSTSLLAFQTPAPPQRTPERIAFDEWLERQAQAALEARRARVAALTTPAAVQAYQLQIRGTIGEMLGLLPAYDGPLQAAIARTTKREGYRVEHLVFESLPGFKVTALAYVPDGAGPFPAVLGTAGHADEGKASATYQHAWISLARRGFLVLAYDPPGQGERLEYVDAKGGSRVGIGTREHMMTGQQLLLSGRTIGAYMVQDGRRALDYLLTRGDVDPKRIAVAGNSGGGTQAALLAAVEPRLAAAVVSCYMTSWTDMWLVPGPQDSEQILPGFVGRGLDFADFAIAAAPRGFLVSSAIRDFFPIAGSRKVSEELAPLYATLGAPDRLARVENDATHGWTQPLREGAYRALGEWLGRPATEAREAPVTTEPAEALRVTTSGQLASSGGSRTIRAMHADDVRAMVAARPAVDEAALRGLLGDVAARPAPHILSREGDPAGGDGERLLVEVEPGIRLQGWLRRPATPSKPPMLLVDDRGATLRGATVDGLVAAGHTVLALDVRGTGALGPLVGESGYSPAYQFAARAWLLGTSVVAWQVRDILQGLAVLRDIAPEGGTAVVRAAGQTAPAALLAAQYTRPGSVVLEESFVSYRDLALADVHDRATMAVVPGVLRVTDLPELMARLGSVPVRLLRPRTPDGKPIVEAGLETHLGAPPPRNVTVEY